MDPLLDVRLRARLLHVEAWAGNGGDRTAAALVDAAVAACDLQVTLVEPGTRFGPGMVGCLDRDGFLVSVAAGLSAPERAFVVAHELGHWKLHADPVSVVQSTPAGLGGIDGLVAAALGQSPTERKEVQADIFAAEFLCPADWLRGELVDRRRRPSEVAASLGIPPRVATVQAIRALLLPPLRAPRPSPTPAPDVVDPSQRAAAEWTGGPLLVEAGPGTGKTRTLVERVIHLAGPAEVPTSSMLALTFSNKAAGEMRERLAARVEGSADMWIGTFHAFGREILAQNHARLGLPVDFRILDLAGGLALLEKHLARLPLRHFQNLYEPAYELLPVLRMISRCKDEMVAPDDWKAHAVAALAAATTDEEVVLAERAVEFGEIYAVHEELLREEGVVDFGDLVMRSTALVVEEKPVRDALRATYPCVLVDEYQDVNLAGATLLQALHVEGARLWVVGDQRQSIYRFRGASPRNVVDFKSVFSGHVLPLEWNYRSGEPVVHAFEAFAATMKLPSLARWRVHRGRVGSARQTSSPTIAGEARAIAATIAALRDGGTPLEEQAILARTHLSLERVTRALEAHGVPLQYLGDLFERPEIRDLLSLIAIDGEHGGVGLLRVAQLAEYGVPRADALAVIDSARRRRMSVRAALGGLHEVAGLSDAGRGGLVRLAADLSATGPAAPPFVVLTTWLFERSSYLRAIVAEGDVASRAKLTAIYHLLKACAPPQVVDGRSGPAFLARIRRIEALEQDKDVRRVAPEAEDEGAVRVMTIHASKGLEFGAVHVSFVATGYTPSKRQGVRLHPPAGLERLVVAPDGHDAEEMALFFVAMSRARDHLSLSRAASYTTRGASASKYLTCLSGTCHSMALADPPAVARMSTATAAAPPARDAYTEREIELFRGCPAAYRYEVVDGLRGAGQASGYMLFHACVYGAIRAMEADAAAGLPLSAVRAAAHLEAEWAVKGPREHAYAAYYRGIAERMVADMVGIVAAQDGSSLPREEWIVDVGGGRRVAITPDRVLRRRDGSLLVQRVRTGKRTKSEADKPVYALLRAAAAQRHPGATVGLETLYLCEGCTEAPDLSKAAEHLDGYATAIAEIEAGRCEPRPGDARRCATCLSYFICGA